MKTSSLIVLLFVCLVSSVCAGEFKIAVESDQLQLTPPTEIAGDQPLRLVELLPFEPDSAVATKPAIWEGGLETFPRSLPRFEGDRDRLYSRWTLSNGDAFTYGHPIAAIAAHQTAIPWPESPKGVQCVVDVDDVLGLGVKYVAQNVDIRPMFDFSKRSDLSWNVDGESFHFNPGAVAGLDNYVSRMTAAGVNVSLILLNYVPGRPDSANPLIHPDTNLEAAPNHLGAFNLSDERGYRHYRAVVEFLADRYTSGRKEQGTISGIIVGNELQAHWWWYNIGDANPDKVINEYARAVRVAYLACAKAHPELRVYVSLDQHWTVRMTEERSKFIPGKELMEGFHARVRSRGDFPWHVAQHPYPQNLFNARTWNDEQATWSPDAPKITFRNLEVLADWLQLPEHLYDGKSRRVILSEQGFHCEEGEEGERVQAAAYAYAFYRTLQFPVIDAFILHRHVDHAHEGGLRLGLRANAAGTISSPGKTRLIYDLFKHADAADWETHFEFAKPIIGIQSWSELDPRPVEPSPAK